MTGGVNARRRTPAREFRLITAGDFPAGARTFTAERSGRYLIRYWGPGGCGTTSVGGGGGAYGEVTRRLARGQQLSMDIGRPYQPGISTSPLPTRITFPGGEVVTAAGGYPGGHATNPGQGGAATGGDVNVSGSSASGANGGAGGGSDDAPGGAGGLNPSGNTNTLAGRTPAGGGYGAANQGGYAGDGLVIIEMVD